MTKRSIISFLAVFATMGAIEFLLFSGIKKNDRPLLSDSYPAEAEIAYFNTFNFANEVLPVADNYVFNRMKRVLHNHSYENLQTYRLHRQASRWFPVIEPILAAYGIPEDFKYIPLVESGLKGGTSPKGASGMWQFMPQTARSYGLRVGGGVDERQQIRKSTIAACKYLRDLHEEFNNWTLAAAAYNIGENKLKRIIAQQDQENYFSIRLNPETSSYVYKLVAMKEIIEHPELHGYEKLYQPAQTINVEDTRYYPDDLLRGLVSLRSQLN